MDPVRWVTLTRHSTICGAPSSADARPGRAVCLESHQPRNRVGGCDAICSTCANREETLGTGKGEAEFLKNLEPKTCGSVLNSYRRCQPISGREGKCVSRADLMSGLGSCFIEDMFYTSGSFP